MVMDHAVMEVELIVCLMICLMNGPVFLMEKNSHVKISISECQRAGSPPPLLQKAEPVGLIANRLLID